MGEKYQTNYQSEKLRMKGVLTNAKADPENYISNIFIRPKSDGSHRLILNLKYLNAGVDHIHFKMETLRCVVPIIKKHSWFASIDLKDADESVPIDPHFRKYLSFYWAGRLYQFTSLPNGLSSAPRVFTKLLKPVFSYLRKQGFTNVCYIDDIFLEGDSYEECLENVINTSRLIDDLIHKDVKDGFCRQLSIIANEKCTIITTRSNEISSDK